MFKLIINDLFLLLGITQTKPHHILTISDLEETRRARRLSPHSHCQTSGLRGRMSPPPLASLSGPASHRAAKSSLPTSPLFPLSDNSVNCQPSRSISGRNSSSGRCPGNKLTSCTSSFFPQSHWQDSSASVSLPYSSSMQHLPRNRLSFELNQSDSVEVPHNFLASPEPEDISPTNGTSPHGDMGKHSKEYSYSSFHRDPSLSLGEEMRAELEIEETLLNEGVAMNCGGQIVVEGDDQEFWGKTQEVHKKKTLVANVSRSAASAKEDLGNTSSDDDMDHYFDFSRTIVSLPLSKDRSKSPSSSSSRPLAQLDGIDDGTESDASVATTDDAHKVGNSGKNQIQRKNLNKISSETSNGGNLPNTSSNDRQTEFSSVAISVSKRCTGDSSPLFCASKTSDTPSVELKILPSSVDRLPNLLTKVPETSYSEETILGSSLGLVPDTPVVFERCDSTPCFTELLPVLHDTPNQSETVLNLNPESNNFASEGSSVLMNPLAIEPSLAESATQNSLIGLLEPSPLMPADTQNHSQCLDDSLEMYSCLPGFSQPPLSSITLQPVMTTQESTNFPPLEPFSTNLTNLTPVEDVTEMQLNVTNTNSPGLAMPGTCPPAVTCAAISISAHPTQIQPFNSAAVTVVSSSSMVSTHSSTAPTPLQTTTAPVMLNGYSSSSVQKEPTAGHTISINFSTPRPAMEPQQPVLPQALPGHAILTVKEVGGPNVDPTPHVLLVNRLGQIFVKNPESNTFQLPTPNSSSYNCVTQIASLLQSNALSATLAAAGNMMAVPPGTNMTAVTGTVTPAVQNPATVTQLLSNNSSTAVALSNAKNSRKNPKAPKGEMAPEMKKAKKKKESNSSKKSKSSKAVGQASLSTETHPVNPAESAQAIINQAMASNYTPKWSGLRTMSPSSLVLPPGLLIEPEPPVSPRSPSPAPAPVPRPRTHVRMKRVSSLSDRIITKKSKVDFLQPEAISEEEEHHEATFPSISSRASGVRIKTPTVKEVLNLDELKEEHMSDSDSSG